MNRDDIIWLAGLIDGEGSVSVTNGACLQLSMTHLPTVQRAAAIIASIIDTPCPVYGYHGKRGHRMEFRVRVTGPHRCLTLARTMVPHAVTKRQHWKLMDAYCQSRVMSHAIRGQRARRTHFEQVLEVASRVINLRGAAT